MFRYVQEGLVVGFSVVSSSMLLPTVDSLQLVLRPFCCRGDDADAEALQQPSRFTPEPGGLQLFVRIPRCDGSIACEVSPDATFANLRTKVYRQLQIMPYQPISPDRFYRTIKHEIKKPKT